MLKKHLVSLEKYLPLQKIASEASNMRMDRAFIINSIKRVAQQTLPPKSSVILFGSRARGDAKTGSDWDVLILLDKPALSVSDYGLAYPFRELGWDLNEDISPQIYSTKEWKDYSYTPFYKNVEHDKIILL